ncbi:MAG TPA: PLP-dependent aminotransferase family protein [Caulobacteraceae bacterium]|jgi:GntR family transcriptional regulator/MocR family aminotransferase|nr:PLP-dependent aminotransferase family protein [Caulobacteraceae bacterium]
MDPLFEIELDLPPAGARDASKRLYDQLKAAILDGRLAAGVRLPPTRRSAGFFGVSRNTAAAIYEQLAGDGLIVTRPGSGAFVAVRKAEVAVATARGDFPLNPVWLRTDIVEAMGFWAEEEVERAPTSGLDFRPALVDAQLFPLEDYRRVSAKALRRLERRPAALKSPQGNQGNYRLREAVARHIGVTRAVVCAPDDVLVTSGAQQAFDLLARVLVQPGETTVAIEDPGYPPMRAAFAAAGARIAPVRVDAEGIVVGDIPVDARVICVCPSHQFPLGVTLSAERRRQLIALARERGAVIVEDDYDGEFRFEGGALEALRTASAADVVFYVGTFSKCMLPSLRLGFLVAPAWALPTLTAAKNCLDWHSATPVQLGVAAFMSEGLLTKHIRKTREIYRRRRDELLGLIEKRLADWLEPIPSFYGMHIAVTAKPDVEVAAAARGLSEAQVKIHTLARYFAGEPTHAGLVFGYGVADLSDIHEGVEAVRATLASA